MSISNLTESLSSLNITVRLGQDFDRQTCAEYLTDLLRNKTLMGNETFIFFKPIFIMSLLRKTVLISHSASPPAVLFAALTMPRTPTAERASSTGFCQWCFCSWCYTLRHSARAS